METTKTSNFTCQSESFISIFFTCQVLACELQPSSCHDFANDKRSQTAKTVFSHLNTHKPTEARTYSVMPLDSLNLTILDKDLSRGNVCQTVSLFNKALLSIIFQKMLFEPHLLLI